MGRSKKGLSVLTCPSAEVDELQNGQAYCNFPRSLKPNNPQPFKPRIFLINGNNKKGWLVEKLIDWWFMFHHLIGRKSAK